MNDKEIMEIKSKMKEAIHDRLLGPNQMEVVVTSPPPPDQRFLTTVCYVTKYKIHEATLSLEIAEEDFEMHVENFRISY